MFKIDSGKHLISISVNLSEYILGIRVAGSTTLFSSDVINYKTWTWIQHKLDLLYLAITTLTARKWKRLPLLAADDCSLGSSLSTSSLLEVTPKK